MSCSVTFSGMRHAADCGRSEIFQLNFPQARNRYYIVSNPSSMPLLASPEVVGFDTYKAVLEPTSDALSFLIDKGLAPDADILTILRGGLNYPLEEACSMRGVRVRNMHFLSCERLIQDNVIEGLAIKYEKVFPGRDRTLMIGDILATGDTFRVCLDRFVKLFSDARGSLRRLVFFTIGGTRAVPLFEDFTRRMSGLFPGFEGVDCFFYEGMFTVYTGKGASGINVPDIDFGWKGGAVSPGFRDYVADHPEALLEKCIIYDGGARRYEIPVHYSEVMEYWEAILERANIIDNELFISEKLGWNPGTSFDGWKKAAGFGDLEDLRLEGIWERESRLLSRAGDLSLGDLARNRMETIKTKLLPYVE